MSVDNAVHRGDVPPPIDLAGHMRELGRALLPALVIAALIGAGVFYVRSELTDKQYAASVVAEIKPAQTLIPGDAFIEQMRAPFIELAKDTNVLDRVLSQVDSDLDTAELASSVDLTPGTSPALLTITVTTGSPDLSAELAQAMVTTMAGTSAANAARESRDGIDGGQPAASGDQLVVLSSPYRSMTPVSPKPVSEALVAALAGLIVAAELIVLLRGRLSRKPSPSWARRVSRRYGAHYDSENSGSFPPVVASRIAAADRPDRHSTRVARHAVSRTDSTILVLAGEGTTSEPNYGGRRNSEPRRATTELGLSESWWQHLDVGDIDTAVVLVSRRGRDKKAATAALRRLDYFDIPVHLVLCSAKKTIRSAPSTSTVIAESRRDAS